MPGFCGSIFLAFISGVELLDYVVDGGGGGRESARVWLGGESQMGDITLRWGGSNPQDAMTLMDSS